MEGYKLTAEQKNALQGQQYANNCYFNPVPDINGDYFIFDEEVEHCVNPDFSWAKELTLSDFTPPSVGPEI